MKRNIIETVMGAVVLIVAASFIYTAYNSSGVKNPDGYRLKAAFEKIDGVGIGSDVRIGGIKIGSVTAQSLDSTTYNAVVELSVSNDIKLPYDTSAEIVSESLMGGKYINLVPGADEEMLGDGDMIEYTQSAINIEQLIGKFAFGSADDKSSESEKDAE